MPKKKGKRNDFRIFYSALSTTLTSFAFGFILTSADFAINAYNQGNLKKLSILETSTIKAIPAIGALFGNVIISNLNANKKKLILGNCILFLFASLFQSILIHSFFPIFSRLIFGVAIGSTCSVVPLYLGDISPVSMRGIIATAHQLQITLGVLMGYLFTISFSEKDSKIGFFCFHIFFAAAFILTLFALPGRNKRLLGGKNFFDLINNKSSKKSVIMASLFHSMQQLSGINILIVYARTLIEESGGDKNLTLYVGLIQVVCSVIFMMLVDKVGRKPMMFLSISVCFASLIGIVFLKSKIKFIYLFIMGFSCGLGPVTWMITSEIFPKDYQSAGNTLSVSMNWIFTFLTIVSVDFLLKSFGFKMFLFNAATLAAFLFYVKICFTETKGRKAEFQK